MAVIAYAASALLALVIRCFGVARKADGINAGGTIAARGEVSPGFLAGRSLGVVAEYFGVSPTTRKELGLAQKSACVVVEVKLNGAAERAGVKTGDTMLTLNGVALTSLYRLEREMTLLTQATAAGKATVALKVIRRDASGQPALLDLTLTF